MSKSWFHSATRILLGCLAFLGFSSSQLPAQEVFTPTTWTLPTADEPTSKVGGYVKRPNGDLVYEASFGRESAGEIESLYGQLRAGLANGPIYPLLDAVGTSLRSKLVVKSCPEVPHGSGSNSDKFAAYTKGFNARVIVTHWVGLKESNGFSLKNNQGEAEVIERARTTSLICKAEVLIDWNPKTAKLSITSLNVAKPEYPAGPSSYTGTFRTTGICTISQLAKKTEVSTSFLKGVFGFDAGVDTSTGKKRFRVTQDGNGYQVTYGTTLITRRGNATSGNLIVTLGATNWMTSVDTNVTETFVSVTEANCTSKSKIKAEVKDKHSGSFGVTLDGACRASTSQLPCTATFSSQPTLNDKTNELEGLFCRSNFVVDWNTDGAGKTTYNSAYQTAHGSGINWALKASVTGDSGGRIDVANKASAPGGLRSNRFNKISLVK